LSKLIVGPHCEKDEKFMNGEVAEILKIDVGRIKKHWVKRSYDGEVFYQLYAEVD